MKHIVLATACSIFISSSIYCSDGKISPTNQELFADKTILILGGTGFLGFAITNEVLKYNPKKVTIFSRCEVKHYRNKQQIGNNPRVYNVVGDIRDYDALMHATRGVDIVFHVAALKRMDLMERNVAEVIKTNVLGSINVFNACVANDVKKVVFISTDKGCLPINAYGGCKFLSEKLFTNYDKSISTQFMVARFGNIFDSTGSAVSLFVRKIKNGENVPLTDPRMTRFIITREDAGELLCDVLRYGIGGEIFIKKLPAFKITDLIDVIKEMFHADNEVKVMGLRPGEKIHEALINGEEMARSFEFQDCYVIKPSITDPYDCGEKDVPVYMQYGTLVDKNKASHFSSDQAVISKEELSVYFEKNFNKVMRLEDEPSGHFEEYPYY